MKLRTLTIAAVLILALSAGPATAAPPKSRDRASGTWVGQVVRHNRHFDYQGRYCPTKEEVCIEIFAKFRIVPVNPQAAAALRRVSGGPAKLYGWRTPASDGKHNGILYVRRVRPA